MANIIIDIAAEYTGNKAFKKAESETVKLTKSVKKLAGAFGIAYSTTQVIAYGKAAVRAAVEDEKAQKQLALALKNVGLGRDVAATEDYIQKLQSEFGIVDDLLRPAYQTLAISVQDTAEAQRLLNLSLDISAATGKDLGSVTAALSRAYLGNNTALSRLGVGISKADLKTKSFLEVTDELARTFKGAASESANSLAGQMAKLEVASANVSEILGKGIIDSLIILSGNTSVDELATDMETAATNAAAFLQTLSQIVKTLSVPLVTVSGSLASFIKATDPFVDLIIEGDPSGFMKKKSKPFTTPMSISGQVQVKQQKQVTKLVQQQAAAQSKITKDKKLQAALDKANLALNKGSEVFDMDKIQIAAALTSQAEQLGKATSSAQQMQIANDVARLNVKRSILDLEDAIAAKDEAAITAATAKLNADLKSLAALTGQNVKLTDIKSILDSLKPVDLINQKNLDDALAKIAAMIKALADANLASKSAVPTSGSLGSGIPKGDFIAPISTKGGSIGAILEYADAAAARANAFADLLDLQNAADAAAFNASPLGNAMGNNIAITINTGVGDPNAIAEAIDQVLVDAVQRGTLRGGSY